MDKETIPGTSRAWANDKTYETSCWLKEGLRGHYWLEQARRHKFDAAYRREIHEMTWTAQEMARFRLAQQLETEIMEEAFLHELSPGDEIGAEELLAVDWGKVADDLLAQ